MEENQKKQDPFVTAMSGAENPSATEPAGNQNVVEKKVINYVVDPGAENVVSSVAEFLKYIGIAAGILAFFAGVVMSVEEIEGGGILIGSDREKCQRFL